MPEWADLPVIVFSAIYNEKMHTGLRLLGVNDVFSKGETDFDILIRRIGEVSGETAVATGAQRKILLVEDDGETRAALERLLRDYGYEVSGVGSAAEAVREGDDDRLVHRLMIQADYRAARLRAGSGRNRFGAICGSASSPG